MLLHPLEEASQSVWSLRSTDRQPGAFRVVSVGSLIATPAIVQLIEWNSLAWDTSPQSLKYAAISHVWKASDNVQKICEEVGRPLLIMTKESAPHEISWHGLIQAAKAAHYLKCTYLWLDLLCIDQFPKDDDKERQIKNMVNIYKNATAVLVMLGGVGAVQSYWDRSSWVLRAWNLQEATLCRQTYGLVTAPQRDALAVKEKSVDGKKSYDEFEDIDDNIAIVRLKDLLKRITGKSRSGPGGEGVHYFGFRPRMALMASLEFTSEEMKHCAAWRSMALRVSQKAQDRVFSMMHLVGVNDIKVDYGRSAEDLYLELAKKAAVRSFPAWLAIGRLCGDTIPFEFRGGLVPKLPDLQDRGLPLTTPNIEMSSVVSDEKDYIHNFDLRFNEQDPEMLGHIICGRVLEVKAWNYYDDRNDSDEDDEDADDDDDDDDDTTDHMYHECDYTNATLRHFNSKDDVEVEARYMGNIKAGHSVLLIGARAIHGSFACLTAIFVRA